jgi:hypothetical protein
VTLTMMRNSSIDACQIHNHQPNAHKHILLGQKISRVMRAAGKGRVASGLTQRP